jgi:DNA-directed RNA polymerase subunit RPC12/RpoP
MALINCKECSKQVSDKADKCPNCGFNIIKDKNTQAASKGCAYIFLGIAAIIFIAVVAGSFSKSDNSNTNELIALDTSATSIEDKALDSINYKKQLDSINKTDEIAEANFKKTKAGKLQSKHPDWTKEECERLAKKQIWIGMNYDMLLYLRGKPNTVNTSNYGNGNEYQCCWDDYETSCFYMKSDNIIYSYN